MLKNKLINIKNVWCIQPVNQKSTVKMYIEIFKNSIISRLAIIIFFILCYFPSYAQQTVITLQSKQTLSLSDVLYLAGKNSLDTYKAKREYGVDYWKYKSFKSSLLPKINFESRPFTFNRSLVKRYDSQQDIDVFREQQVLNTYANVSITQNIRATGTTVFINSSFDRLVNTGDSTLKSFNVTPVRIGLNQPIMAFNSFKWEHKTEPLRYQKAKQDFIYGLQSINIKTVDLFFDWALASKKVSIAEENKQSAEKLFKIGKKRYDLGSIERNDLLNLELDVFNAKTRLTQNLQNLKKTEAALKIFLRDELPKNVKPELPELISNTQIDVDKAIQYANTNNPKILNLKLRKIEALRDLDKAIKDNRFDLSVTASYGLNQQSDTYRDAYGNLLDQQIVSVNFNVPILDWGERKGRIKTAKMNKDVIFIELQQNEDTFKQNITLKVIDFNLQKELVEGALKTSEIARESYKITEKRYISGRIDLLNLTSSRLAWQQATERYIQSLYKYWKLYYEVQQLTLYDFMAKKPIEENIDEIFNK